MNYKDENEYELPPFEKHDMVYEKATGKLFYVDHVHPGGSLVLHDMLNLSSRVARPEDFLKIVSATSSQF